MITGKELKDWANSLADDDKVGIADDMLVSREAASTGLEDEFIVGDLPTVDDEDEAEEGPPVLYEVEVSETRDYKRTYWIATHCKNADAAIADVIEKAERGETEQESEGTLTEISGREIISTPKKSNS